MSALDPNRDRFILIDGHALIYRSFFAFPELTSPDGTLVNAVYGFARILLTVIQDFDPEYIAVAFDHKDPTKRSEEYKEYKAHREPMPSELIPQIELIKDFVKAMNIPEFEVSGYEADDLIGTIVKQLDDSNVREVKEVLTMIVTGDKDMFQLVDDNTSVFIPGRGRFSTDKEYDEATVKKKMGVGPDRIVDLKALMGDSSDNIPGVKGIGPKTAVALLQKYDDLDAVYAQVEKGEDGEVIKGAVFTKLKNDRDNAYLSLQLAKIEQDSPIKFDLKKCVVKDYDKHQVSELFEELGFKSLVQLLPKDDFELGVQDALF